MSAPSGTHRQLSCMIHSDLMKRVDAYARRMGLTRTAAVVVLLHQGLAGEAAGAPQPSLFPAKESHVHP